MSEAVYIETSVLGYLTARPSRDIVGVASIEIAAVFQIPLLSYHEASDYALVKTTMLKTFKAWLKGSRLEWIGDAPDALGEQMLQVHVTFLDDKPALESKTRGQRMAEILENLAAIQGLGDIDPVLWQRETRQDRSLLGR
jgi:hypothetical protein